MKSFFKDTNNVTIQLRKIAISVLKILFFVFTYFDFKNVTYFSFCSQHINNKPSLAVLGVVFDNFISQALPSVLALLDRVCK